MPKSPDAFRTISEVADWLGVQPHVLRFWESKFAQVKPIKRAGGRRYYRPADMLLIGGIKKLLHDDGLTIKGTQKLLREKGVAYVSDLSQALDDLTMAVIEGQAVPVDEKSDSTDSSTVPMPPDLPEALQDPVAAHSVSEETDDQKLMEPEVASRDGSEADASQAEQPITEPQGAQVSQATPDSIPAPPEPTADNTPEQTEDIPEAEDMGAMPTFRPRPRSPASTRSVEDAQTPDAPSVPEAAPDPVPSAPPPLETPAAAEPTQAAAPSPEPVAAKAPEVQEDSAPVKPRQIDVAPVPAYADIAVQPSALAALSRVTKLTPEIAREIKPLVARLNRYRASMASAMEESGKD